MEQRPAPQVTITGGAGWQVEPAARDEVSAGQRAEQRRRPRLLPALLVGVALLGGLGVAQRGPAGPAGPPDPPEAAEAVDPDRPPADEPGDGPSLVLNAADVRFEGDRAVLSVEVVRNTSEPLSLVGVRTIPGLAVRLVRADGQDVGLPLDVDDAVVQAPPASQEGPTELLLAEFTLASCASLPPFGQPYRGGTLVELQTAGPDGPGSTFVGGRYPLVPRFRQDC